METLTDPSTSSYDILNSSNPNLTTTPAPPPPAIYFTSQQFMFVCLSVIIPAGLLCNTAAIGVFLSAPLRRRAGSWYLAALAFSDDLALLAALLDYWLKDERVGVALVKSSHALCVAVTHISYSSRLFSALMVTSFTIERFIGVVYPLKRAVLTSTSHARRVILIEAGVSLLAASFTICTIGVVHASYGTECDVRPERAKLYLIFNVICLIFGSIVLPIVIICSVNAFILRKLCRRKSRLMQRRAQFQYGRHHVMIQQRRAREFNMAAVVLTVSTTFVVLNIPYCVCWFVLFAHHFIAPIQAPQAGWYLFAAKYFTTVPYYLNFAINFILYSLCSKAFRVELSKCLCLGRQQQKRSCSFKAFKTPALERDALVIHSNSNPTVRPSPGAKQKVIVTIYEPNHGPKLLFKGRHSS